MSGPEIDLQPWEYSTTTRRHRIASFITGIAVCILIAIGIVLASDDNPLAVLGGWSTFAALLVAARAAGWGQRFWGPNLKPLLVQTAVAVALYFAATWLLSEPLHQFSCRYVTGSCAARP